MLTEVTEGMHRIHKDIGPFRDVLRTWFALFGSGHQIKQSHTMHALRESSFPLLHSTFLVVLPSRHPAGRNGFPSNFDLPNQFECPVDDATDVAEKDVRMVW